MVDATITAAEFEFVATWLRSQCALVLEPGKEYLVQSRLAPLAQRYELTSVSQLISRLRNQPDQSLRADVIDAMVTTETSFFRDVYPFETLRKTVLPGLIDLRRQKRELNVWCAACSSGQEPYTIALIVREHFPELASWRVNITATDISHLMLNRSRQARYTQLEVNRGLPTTLMLKWFRQDGMHWQLADEIRQLITFTPLNLAHAWPAMPMWDLVFMRNVMIYFDNSVKKLILARVAKQLSPHGYLVLGGAETTFGLNDSFQRVEELKSGYYRLKRETKP